MVVHSAIALGLVVLGIAAALGQAPPALTATHHTPSATNGPRVVQRPDSAQLKLPAGFQISELASGFEAPRHRICGPSGEILLSGSAKAGGVYALVDKHNDGRIGYPVAFGPFRDGKSAGPVEGFLTGFMTGPNSKEVWGRPVGLLPMQDGSLRMSNDGGKKL